MKTELRRLVVTLSARQSEVMRMICDGYRDKEIADRLSISIFTVRDHATRAMVKLGACNRENAVFILTKGGPPMK